LRILQLKEASRGRRMIAFDNNPSGVAKVEEEVPAVNVVELLVADLKLLAIGDFETAVRGHTTEV
jgi:hypothetical protein